jgi:hypothetical protein
MGSGQVFGRLIVVAQGHEQPVSIFRQLCCAPALAGDAHCYTRGAAIVPDLFDTNPSARKLRLMAEAVTLGREFPDEPGTYYIEITTNADSF